MYSRILLKLSGEAFAGSESAGIDMAAAVQSVTQIIEVLTHTSVKLAIVVGGGNLIRGAKVSSEAAIPQASADMIGMLGTVMNGLTLQRLLEARGHACRTFSALAMPQVCESYTRDAAMIRLETDRVVILAGGTGNPFLTTDTTSAVRALELGCDVLMKATKVDGVYSADPVREPGARRYDTITYEEALEKNLRVMDGAALSLCRDHSLPTVVFNFFVPGNLLATVNKPSLGTLITV